MKRLYIVANLLLSIAGYGQAPQLIPYQAIARDASGQPLANAALNARFTIHDQTAIGATVWQEIQTVTTSALGLFTAQLGSSISLASVNWGEGSKFMQVEIDLGSGFLDIGTQQMLSVPYALYSQNAANGFMGISPVGDTLFLGNGTFVNIPGISGANGGVSFSADAHSCGAENVHNPDIEYGTMTDQEGNTYKTVIIGTQEWMAENLNTSIYRNGNPITTGLTSNEWTSTTSGAWTYYNNDDSYECPYGKLYNWYACVDSRELCPTGWHVPSYAEKMILTNYLGMLPENINYGYFISFASPLKSEGTLEAGTGLWYTTAGSFSDNAAGFSALPGGVFLGSLDDQIGRSAEFWTKDGKNYGNNSGGGWSSALQGNVYYRSLESAFAGASVRCIRDGGGTITGAHSCSAQNIHNPNLEYGQLIDQEGNEYKTIIIGTQEWMAENLKTSKYRTGDPIATGLSANQLLITNSGAWAYYGHDSSFECPYGKLYNSYACTDTRGLCPVGWHVPTNTDFSNLIDVLDPINSDGVDGYSAAAGAVLKSTGTIEFPQFEANPGFLDRQYLWFSPNTGATNSSGFSGLPGGNYNGGFSSSFSSMGYNAFWWSSTIQGNTAYILNLYSNDTIARANDVSSRQSLLSVRCIRD